MKTITKLKKNFPNVEFIEHDQIKVEGRQTTPPTIEMRFEGRVLTFMADMEYDALADAVNKGLLGKGQ